ncbi:MAG: helix-turn-helix domain-containing protein [Peptococcaceae bacterium]|nr:helix-turn-helix domain-containing protein [Peptococcaceae bacterium]
MNAYSSIIKGLQEAVEYEKGNLKGVKKHVVTVKALPVYKAKEIKKIRTKLDLSQSAFANIIGVSKKAVEAWEAGVNIPQGPAQRRECK